MSSYKKSSGSAPLIITIITAVIATAAVVIVLMTMNKEKTPEVIDPSKQNSAFEATSQLHIECADAAKELVSANYEIIRLYVTEGLPLKSVYGKDPEPIDGAYEVNSDKYTEYKQIETLVESVYTDEAAQEILKRTEVSDGGAVKKIQVYAEHNIHGAVFLGMNTEFSADKEYKTDWSNCYVITTPESESKCGVTVYVNGISADDAESHPESVLKTSMIKTADGWRLTSFLK